MTVICLLCQTVYLTGYLPGDFCPNESCDENELVDMEEYMRIIEDIETRESEDGSNNTSC